MPDIHPQQVALLRDKLRVRRRLTQAGLSQVRACRIGLDNFESLKLSGRPLFVKPVRGVASYGAFPLQTDTRWEHFETIIRDAQRDTFYHSIFNGAIEFMAEDYIPGREFSFEILCRQGERHVMAIHEKLEMTESGATVLEDCCTSPPLSISDADIAAAVAWLDQVFGALGLQWGCYHVEARCADGQWELIEINPVSAVR